MVAGESSKRASTRGASPRVVGVLALAALGWFATAAASDVALGPLAAELTSPLERILVSGMRELREGDLEAAHDQLRSLVEAQPDFRLARVLEGDAWMARATGLSRFGHGLPRDERAEELLFEARARWSRYSKAPPPSAMPDPLIKVPQAAPSVLVVDLLENRLFVFEPRDGGLAQTSDFYVSIGKNGVEKQREGDDRTPVGFYLVKEYLAGDTLPDLYGLGAFPINYPNGWDRLNGRTGSGIWIHGTESTTYSRPPRSSRGCVTLSNQDFEVLTDSVAIRATPVIVSSGLGWIPADLAERRRRQLEQLVEAWRQAWESRDTTRYLAFYSEDFRTQGMSRAAFADYKRRVNQGKEFIRVRLDDMGIYRYPGESDLVVIDFKQHYESDSFRSSTRKHQYWRREPSGWRIVFEERL